VPAVRAIRARHYSLRGALENANDSGGVVGKSEVIQIGLPISKGLSFAQIETEGTGCER
jgi:hypothetical protein